MIKRSGLPHCSSLSSVSRNKISRIVKSKAKSMVWCSGDGVNFSRINGSVTNTKMLLESSVAMPAVCLSPAPLRVLIQALAWVLVLVAISLIKSAGGVAKILSIVSMKPLP
jgi:hypothetical protein